MTVEYPRKLPEMTISLEDAIVKHFPSTVLEVMKLTDPLTYRETYPRFCKALEWLKESPENLSAFSGESLRDPVPEYVSDYRDLIKTFFQIGEELKKDKNVRPELSGQPVAFPPLSRNLSLDLLQLVVVHRKVIQSGNNGFDKDDPRILFFKEHNLGYKNKAMNLFAGEIIKHYWKILKTRAEIYSTEKVS